MCVSCRMRSVCVAWCVYHVQCGQFDSAKYCHMKSDTYWPGLYPFQNFHCHKKKNFISQEIQIHDWRFWPELYPVQDFHCHSKHRKLTSLTADQDRYVLTQTWVAMWVLDISRWKMKNVLFLGQLSVLTFILVVVAISPLRYPQTYHVLTFILVVVAVSPLCYTQTYYLCTLPQQHTQTQKDPRHSAKFVSGRLQPNTHSLSVNLHSQKLAAYINTHTHSLRVPVPNKPYGFCGH